MANGGTDDDLRLAGSVKEDGSTRRYGWHGWRMVESQATGRGQADLEVPLTSTSPNDPGAADHQAAASYPKSTS